VTGWQNQNPGMPDPYGPPAQQQPPPWGSSPSGHEQPGYEQPGYEEPGYEEPGYEEPAYQPRRRSYDRPSTQDDPIPLPDKRGKGMYVAGAFGGVVVLLMISAIVYAVMGGGTQAPRDTLPSSTPIPGGAANTGAVSDDPSPGGGGGPKDVTLVAAADGYKLWTGPLADEAIASEKKHLIAAHPTVSSQISAAKFGIYKKGTSLLHVVSQTAGANPAIAVHLHAVGPAKAADEMLMDSRSVGRPKNYPAGPKGGVIHCVQATENSGSTVRCAWADESTIVDLEANRITMSKMAALTLNFRNAAEN
jgi:hypothetical protein